MNTTTKEQIRLYLTDDTCRLAAQLRAAYKASGHSPASLTQVVEDAIEFLHYKCFENRGIPTDWEDFTKKEGPNG